MGALTNVNQLPAAILNLSQGRAFGATAPAGPGQQAPPALTATGAIAPTAGSGAGAAAGGLGGLISGSTQGRSLLG